MGHKSHFKKLFNTVDGILIRYEPSLENDLLSINDCLVRKSTVVNKLDEDILDNIEDEEGIAKEIDTASKVFLAKR